MHQAPAVQWRVPRMQAHALVLVLVWLLGLAAHSAWWLQAGQTAVAPHVWGLVVVLGTAGTSFAGWAMTGSGRLDWSGDTWTWNADGRAPVTGNLVTALDFQRLIVLRFDTAAVGARWLWVGHAGGGAPWRAFRRAVFSSQETSVAQAPSPVGQQTGDRLSR